MIIHKIKGKTNASYLSLNYPLITSLIPTKGTGAAAFTRATTATVEDFEGLVRNVKSGEARFKGARRVENSIATRSADASGGGGWVYLGTTTVAIGGAVTWSPGSALYNLTNLIPKANQVVVLSFTASATIVTNVSVRIDRDGIGQGNQQIYTLNSIPKRYSLKATLDSNTTQVPIARFDCNNGNVTLKDFQIEEVTGQANQNPSEYVSNGTGGTLYSQELITSDIVLTNLIQTNYSVATGSLPLYSNITVNTAGGLNAYIYKAGWYTLLSPLINFQTNVIVADNIAFYNNSGATLTIPKGSLSMKRSDFSGANVDGVKYFDTYNGNTVSSNIVTETTGAKLPEASLKGVISEVSSTNFFLQSESFDNASWIKIAPFTIVTDSLISPAGTLTADKLTILGGNSSQRVSQTTNTALTAGTSQTISVWVYPSTGVTTVGLRITHIGDTSTSAHLDFIVTANSWQRLSFTKTVATSATGFVGWIYPCGTANDTDNSSGKTTYLWGAQLESKPFASSYIPTTTASVTRNADFLTFPSAGNVSDTAGTVLMDTTPAFDIPNSGAIGYGYHYLIDFASSFGAIFTISNTLRRFDGTTTVTTPAWLPLKGTTYKIGSRYGSQGQRNFLNGVAGTNVAFNGSIASATNMTIGGSGGGTTYNWGGSIKNLKVYKKELPDFTLTELQKSYLVDATGSYITDETNLPLFTY